MPSEAGENDRNLMAVYESHPPTWLPKTHGSADLGYSGFHPPRPGQDEDVMSPANVKNGFNMGDPVPAETFSAQDMIKSRFTQHDALTELEDLMNEIFSRRADNAPAVPSSTFRMPSRVTLNDSKRQAWFADLANPDVPLHKLGKNVPHGAKGHDLLDLLQSNNVAIPRAVWFLRVFGANETAGLRNKGSYNPTQYSVDWANVVTGYLKKQLADIALPSAPRAGLNIKQTFKGVLADTDSRTRWISRFTYSLRLLRTFYSQGLVDNRTFLTWLVQTMASCNLAQAGFVVRLGDEYLDGMLGSRALTKPFVDACLGKLVEIRTTSAQEYLPSLEALLITLLQRICLALPDAFVSIHTWTTYSTLLTEILSADITQPDHPARDGGDHNEWNAREVQRILLDNFLDVKQRNEAMLFRTLPPRVLASLGSTVMDIQLLNSISSTTDMETVPFFDGVSDEPSLFAEKINTLLTWAITPLQFGDHRPYAAATLLRLWRHRYGERAMRRDFTSPDDFLQDQLFDWLDESELAGEEANLSSVVGLFGKLVRDGLFEYAKYVQRLVARGEPGLSYTQEAESRHRKFLRCIPLHHPTSSLVSQRKVTLHGARARETPEDLNEREIRKEIRAVLPQLFGGEARPNYLSSDALLNDCPILFSASRFEQVRTFRQWLFPILRKAVDSQTHGKMNASSLLQTYCVSVELMAQTKCHGSIFELNLFVLQRASDSPSLMTAVIETFHRYVTIWTCMGSAATITAALYAAHQVARARGVQSRVLLALLVEIDNGQHLDAPSREHVSADIAAFTHALHPDSETPDHVPPVLPEILLLADDPNPEAPSILANSLWYKYRTAFDWAWKVWDNTVASLRQIPVMTFDVAGRQECALCYGRFLLHVDQHLPGGIDDQVLQWFLGTGKNEVSALSADAWDVLTFVLLYLTVHGALAATTILRGLVYPAWQLSASTNSEQHGESLAIFLGAANNLCDKLLLRDVGGTDGMAPVDLLEVQRIRTRRQTVYREPHFLLLVTAIPTLLFIENNVFISENLRRASASLRMSICAKSDFRQGAHRNLDAVRNAFEQPLLSENVIDDLGHPLLDALRLILSDSPSDFPDVGMSDWHNISSLLSPWRLAATAIQLQFTLRQGGRLIAQESSSKAAHDCLDKLTADIFHHSMTSEEAYFVAEMARGVDGAVAGKFINNGLQCMSEMLRNTSLQPALLTDCIQRAGQLLRVLAHVIESMREEAALLPQLDPVVQDEFIDVICAKLEAVASILAPEGKEPETSFVSRGLIFLARLLQFDLGFRGAWTAKTKGVSSQLVSTLFRLAIIHGSGKHIDLVTYPLLVDTLYYVLDEIPADSKSPIFDPFRNYPSLSASELPTDMPTGYRTQLRSLLPYVPHNVTISNLVTAHRDSSGHLVLGPPVQNRPWEWIENLGDYPIPDTKHDHGDDGEGRVRYQIRNSASLSLDLFNARASGDGIISSGIGDDPRIEANIRSFEDGLSAESVFKRDWRETRTELDDDIVVGGNANRAEEVDELGGLPSFPRKADRQPVPRSRRPSPTSSVRSHKSKSTDPSIAPSSARSSPLQPPPLPRLSNSSSSEPPAVIDVDAPSAPATTTNTATNTVSSTRRTSKRKLSSSDDEIEIIEGPAAAPGPSRAGKKPKGNTTAKTKAKKR